MWNNLIVSKFLSRYFILTTSLFASKPIFDQELGADNKAKLLESATSVEERRLLAKDYETLAQVNGLTKYCLWCLRLFTAFHHLSMVSAVFYIYVMHFQIRIFPKENRLVVELDPNKTTTESATYSYACIRSNCSPLLDPNLDASRSELFLDRLPIFSICHPDIGRYYEPFHLKLGVGTVIYVTNIVVVWLTTLQIFVLQSALTMDHSMLVFLVAPNLAYKVMLERAKQHLKEVQLSYKNYLESQRAMKFIKMELARFDNQQITPDSVNTNSRFPHHCTVTMRNMMICKLDRVRATPLAHDCLPLIRSEWWHKILIKSLKILAPLPLFLLLSFVLAFCYYNFYSADQTRNLMREMQADIESENCSIWRHDDDHSIVKLDLTQISFDLNLYTIFLVCFVTTGWPYLYAIVLLSNVLGSTWELRCWICQLRYKLTMVQPLVRNLFQWPNGTNQFGDNNRRQIGFESNLVFSHDKFRAQSMNDIQPSWLRIRHNSFVKFSKRVANEQALEENYYRAPVGRRRGDPEGDLAELLAKFYVELRLMNELREDIEPAIALVAISTISLNYLICFTAIYVMKMMHDFPPEPMFIVVCVNLMPMTLIMNSVSANNQLLKLSPLVASIVADLSLATNSQLRHMRTLWLRVSEDLDPKSSARGGPFRVHFTYVTMLQVLFSVATVFLFLLKA